ncbi:ABC transporter permease [Mesorhizobium xinjiangense]|uniref:ABC transporter permease n=1 Tax=Mesorhizobium xinjiangense TaxID=2678685 RepID=UPI0038B27EB8
MILLGLVILLAACADVIAPYGFADQNLDARLQPPWFAGGSADYLLGTDTLGRDVLSRIFYGARTSILVALGATAFGFLLGTTLGFVAARFRGWIEEAVMMLVDIQAALPTLVLALAVLAFLGNSLPLLIILVGLDGWERYARLTRGMVLSAKESGYVMSMRIVGAPEWRIYLRHILPNIAGGLIVQATLNFPGTIILETALSFFGLGVQPPMTSLGQMLGNGRAYLINAWWIAIFSGVVIFLTTLSMCLIGDWLRDRLDPTLTR